MFTLCVLRSKGLKAALAVGALVVGLIAQDSQAGLFDTKSNSKPKPTKSAKSSSKQVTQAQYTEPVVQQGESVIIGEAGCDDRCPPGMRMHGEKTFDCFNCGSEDGCQGCTKQHARKCGDTWYPRVAPYCAVGWGYTQPCWRRTQDTYNCPKPTIPGASTPATPLPMPPKGDSYSEPPREENPLPDVPPLPPETASRR